MAIPQQSAQEETAEPSQGQMTPEEMGEMQSQKGQKGTSITDTIQAIGEGLSTMAQMLDKSPATTPEDKQSMMQIMQMFSDLVEKQLSQAPGQNPETKGPSEIPMEGNGVPMGPQMRQ